MGSEKLFTDKRLCWKKVLRQEKNGFTAIFVIFLVFQIVRSLLLVEKIDLNSVLFISTILSIILYYILKYFKRYTQVLNDER